MVAPIDVFISFVPEDDVLLKQLESHLSALKREGLISPWNSRCVDPGENWRNEIHARLDSARVILLLVSADFLASDYCNDLEVARALERQRAGEARVILVSIRACDMQVEQFKGLEMLPRNGKAVTSWPNADEAWEDVALGLRQLIGKSAGRRGTSPRRANDPLDDLLVPGTAAPLAEPSPAALLNASYKVVPFFGRAPMLKEIRTWCDDSAPVRARLFHGAGGMGKTRLFIEACEQLRREGWRAGFLPGDVDAQQFEALIAAERPTLAVIDYAESRPDLRDRLKAVARLRAGEGRGRLRLVLLARNASDWWSYLLGSDAEVGTLLGDHAPREMPPLVSAEAERVAAFREAVALFAIALGRAPPTTPPPKLEDRRYDQVLYLHMAALATVEGLPFTVETLMRSTLDHEQRFWVTRFPHGDIFDEQIFTEGMRRVVTALTLRGGAASRSEAEALVVRIMEERDEKLVQRRVLFLHDLYPGQRRAARGSSYLSGLDPDLLGEAMVHRTLAHERGDVGAYLDHALGSAAESKISTAFEVLGRLSGDHGDDAEGWIEHVIEGDVPGRALPALIAAKAVGERTAHARLGAVLARVLARKGTVEIAKRLERELPEKTVALREVALWTTETLLVHMPEATEPALLAERAGHLNDLGNRQSALGQREAALASTQEAVAIRRTLAQARPDTFVPDLAKSLNNLGNAQSELGQREAALASTREAVHLYRTLALARPDAFLSDLAKSLNNMGIRQRALGQWEDALASMREAVDLYRTLAQARPDAFRPDLAMGLLNLGIGQSALGQWEDALASMREAVDLHRTLAQARPDAFLPELAKSLTNLGVGQSALGQPEDALASTREAVDFYRMLAQARPAAFLPELAASLNNLGVRQSALGQREDALASTREAVDLRRTLAQARPDAFLPELAGSLNNLGNRQSALGQREDALASTREAVDLYRPLAQARRDAFLPELAGSLDNLGNRQSALGQREDALASTREAVDLYRPLAQARPDTFRLSLASSLHCLGIRQSALEQWEDARASMREAVAILRTLAQAQKDAFLPNLAKSLHNLGIMQSTLGQWEDALASAREAVAHSRTLAQAQKDAFLPELTRSLHCLGIMQNELGQREDALASTREAVALRRTLAQAQPDIFLPDLADSLHNLGIIQSALGQHEDALASTQEATAIRSKLALK